MSKKPWVYSLEYYVSTGCNNCCVGCSHGAPLHNDLIDVDTFVRDLKAMKGNIKVHRLALSGGEPLLNKDLPELMQIANDSEIAHEVMVITNGKLIDTMPEEFWVNLDVLRISVYPGQHSQEDLDRWEERVRSAGGEFMAVPIGKFYLPMVKKTRNLPQTQEVFSKCIYFRECSAIFRGRYYPCSQAFWLPEVMGVDPDIDSMAIFELTSESLGEFMHRENSLVSCQRCSYHQNAPWKTTTNNAWLKESTLAET